MNKGLIFVCACLFILSGMNINATNDAEEVNHIIQTFSFEQPTFSEHDGTNTINIHKIDNQLIKPGKPTLPLYEKTYTFPFGTKVKDISCKIQNTHFSTIDNDIEYTPMPVVNGQEEKSTLKTDKSESTIFPEKWYDFDIGTGLKGIERKVFVKLSIFPVRHHSKTKQFEYIDNIDIDISYTTHQVNTFSINEEYKFLILSAPEFASNLNPLFIHKTNTMNLSTKIVTTSEIYSGEYFNVEGKDHQEKIKYFIKNAIEQWETKYVMFVGGSDYFPTRDTHIYVNYNEGDDEVFVSDLYYADIYDEEGNFSSWDTNENGLYGEYNWTEDGNYDDVDLYPDVHFGRIAATSSDMVDDVINKIITYESNEAWTKNWFNTMVVIGGDTSPDEETGLDEGEFINQHCLDYMDGFVPDKIWDSNKRLSGVSPSGLENINNGFENGCGFVDWAGHGGTSVWTTYPHNGSKQSLPTPWGSYFSYHIMDLENEDKLPIVVTGACSVGKFNTNPNCFTWSFVKNPNGGGIGSFGPSGLSWGYTGPWCIEALGGKVNIGYFKAYNEGAYTFGEMHTGSLNNYISPDMDCGDHKTLEQWTPFGDPSLMVRSESQPPEKPILNGPASGTINKEQTYTATATDPDNDEISFLFDWGDNTYSEWIGPVDSGDEVEATHSWEEQGDYQVRVKVKDERGVQSEWSDPLPISMPHKRDFSIIQLFEKLLETFPFLFYLFD